MITIIILMVAVLCLSLGFLLKLGREYKFRGNLIEVLRKENSELRKENEALKRELKKKGDEK